VTTSRLHTLRLRLAGAIIAAMIAGGLAQTAVTQWPMPQLLRWLYGSPQALAAAGIGPALWRMGFVIVGASWLLWATFWASSALVAPLQRLLRGLEGAVLSYRDGDFSVSIAPGRDDELGALVRQHNALGQALREQRQHLAQRELLLDTVVQNTPVALVLVDAHARVAYANIAARHLLADGRSFEGSDFAELLRGAPLALQRAVEAGEDTLLTVPIGDEEETFHVSQRSFRLQGRAHRLHLFRRMTRELSRQEVATWKRVIRVISHELNNSLAPISSMAHSGAELVRRKELDRLAGVLATIGERAAHLHEFLEGYARFAKLPAPQPQAVAWAPFLEALAQHYRFRLEGRLPDEPGWFDPAQMEQALINLLKNSHEAGGDVAQVTLALSAGPHEWRVELCDRGPGMSEAVLGQALLPFYSTKRSGSGLGLALSREIVEAHGGKISLANRQGGGLRVTLTLPLRRVEARLPEQQPSR